MESHICAGNAPRPLKSTAWHSHGFVVFRRTLTGVMLVMWVLSYARPVGLRSASAVNPRSGSVTVVDVIAGDGAVTIMRRVVLTADYEWKDYERLARNVGCTVLTSPPGRFSSFRLCDVYGLTGCEHDGLIQNLSGFHWLERTNPVPPSAALGSRTSPYASTYRTICGLTVPFWSLVAVLAFDTWAQLRRTRVQELRAARGQCAICGYDLRASNSRCPECGAACTSP
jgi:hypothetical protein